MGFINPTKAHKAKTGLGPKERVDEISTRKPEEHTIFAVFIFHLRSTADLNSLGYQNVPIRYAAEPPANKVKKERPPTAKGRKGRLESEAESEGLTEVELNSDLFDDPEDDEPPRRGTPMARFKPIQKPKPTPKEKKPEGTPTPKTPRKVTEFPPRPTLRDIFQSTPEAEAETAASTPSTPTAAVARKDAYQTKVAGNDKDVSSQVEKSRSQLAEQIVEPENPEEVPTPTVATGQLSNKENEEPVGTKFTPMNKPFIGGGQDATKVTPVEKPFARGLGDTMKVTKGMPVQKPFVRGLQAAPAHHAWVERDLTQEDHESQPLTQVDRMSQLLQDDLPGGQENISRSQRVLSNTDLMEGVSYSHDGLVLSFPGHNNQDQSSHNVVGWMNQSVSHNEPNIDSPQSANMDTTLRDESPEPDNSPFTFKRSPYEDSEGLSQFTEAAIEAEIQEMVKRSERNPFQTPESSARNFTFLSSPPGSIYHSKPSPILGSSFDFGASPSTPTPNPQPENPQLAPIPSVRLRLRSVSPPGLAAAQAKLYWAKRDPERAQTMSPSHDALANKGERPAGFLSPVKLSPWRRRGSEGQHGDFFAELAGSNPVTSGELGGKSKDDAMEDGLFVQSIEKLSDVAPQPDTLSDLLGERQKASPMNVSLSKDSLSIGEPAIPLTPQADAMSGALANPNESVQKKSNLIEPRPMSCGTLAQTRMVDATNGLFSDDGESSRKTNKPPHERKTTEVDGSKLQGVPATKRKAEYITDAATDHCNPTPKRMSASELAKAAMTTAELKKIQAATNSGPKSEVRTNVSTLMPSKQNFGSASASRATPDMALPPAPMTPEEISAKRKATQERIAAAAKRKEALQKELEDAHVLKQQLNEIREMEQAAADAERENEELQAKIEIIYGAVKGA